MPSSASIVSPPSLRDGRAQASRPAVLIMGIAKWSGTYMKSTVALAKRLASSCRVLYVEHPPTYASLARRAASGAIRSAWFDARRRTPHVRAVTNDDGDALHVLTPPPVLPLNRLPRSVYRFVLDRNADALRRGVRTWLDRLSMDRPVVVNALNPHYGSRLVGAFNEAGRIYYAYDHLSGRAWNRRHSARLEAEYLDQVDAVVTSSHPLLRRSQKEHDQTVLVRNGVHYDLFSQALDEAYRADTGDAASLLTKGDAQARPNERCAPPRDDASRDESDAPCIGYVGSLDERLDYDLLNRLVEAHPTWTFRFVGRRTSPEADRLARHAQVTLTGPRPPRALPDEMRAMDVGLIPFQRTSFTRYIYPLKANEYLAAGLPVVSTDFADLRSLRAVVDVAPTHDAFLSAVHQAATRPGSPQQVRRRTQFAASNSWRRRAASFHSLIRRVRSAHARPGANMRLRAAA